MSAAAMDRTPTRIANPMPNTVQSAFHPAVGIDGPDRPDREEERHGQRNADGQSDPAGSIRVCRSSRRALSSSGRPRRRA